MAGEGAASEMDGDGQLCTMWMLTNTRMLTSAATHASTAATTTTANTPRAMSAFLLFGLGWGMNGV